MSLSDFLHMGGYAAYVWSAFGLTALVLIGNIVLARAGFASERDQLRRRLAAERSL